MGKEAINIIIVEDDKGQQQAYMDSLEEFNIECSMYEINSIIMNDDADIPKILYEKRIDALIIDLDWGNGNRENEGNKLVEHIYSKCRLPIFVVSGNLHLLDRDYDVSPIFKKYSRDDVDFDKLYQEIIELYSTGYTEVMGNLGKLDEMLRKVFWNYMINSINIWRELDKDVKIQRMLRFATTRVNELLTINPDEEHDDYDAYEFYIKPPIKNKPFTGDIIDYENTKYIVLTAACDMEQSNSDFVVLCKIDFQIFESLKAKIISQDPVSGQTKSELMKYINNNKPRYHLLPPCDIFSGALVDFQQIKSISKDDFYEKACIYSSINPVFIKDIQARFSQYYGRQGQPQLEYESILNWIKKTNTVN